MRSYLLAAVAAVVFPAAYLAAQQAPDTKPAAGETKWTKELVESPPARELQFEESGEPYFMQIAPDPQLRELKSIATLRFNIPHESRAQLVEKVPPIPGTVPLNWVFFFKPIHFDTNTPRLPGQKKTTFGDVMQELIDSLPAEQRPSEAVTAYLTSDTIASRFWVDVQVERRPQDDPQMQRTVQLLAKSPEEAQAVASGLVKIIDWGVSRPVQLHLLEQRPPRVEGVAEAQEKLNQITSRLGVESEDVAGLGSFSDSETKNRLRTLSVELIVERAGIQARLDTCEKLLAGELSSALRARVEQQRLEAQIDLASVETRRKTIQATFDLTGANSALLRAKSALRAVDAMLEQFAPPEIEQPIRIQPIAWQ